MSFREGRHMHCNGTYTIGSIDIPSHYQRTKYYHRKEIETLNPIEICIVLVCIVKLIWSLEPCKQLLPDNQHSRRQVF